MVQVQRGDGLAALRQAPVASLHAIFLDPPFASDLFVKALTLAALAVKPDGFVYLEAPEQWPAEKLESVGLTVYRHLKAGAVHAHLLRAA
jgi:16S rRNA G966 N2-methylase RsmD